MAAHRYWRITELAAHAASRIELSSLYLIDGTTRVDATATISSSAPASTGAVSNLQDGSLSTSAGWLIPRGLTIDWDFGSGSSANVTDIAIGAADTLGYFPLRAQLQWSDDGTTWTASDGWNGITWPGARTLTTSIFKPTTLWSRGDKASIVTLNAARTIAFVGSGSGSIRAEDYVSAGKHQIEFVVGADTSSSAIGVGTSLATLAARVGDTTNSWAYRGNGQKALTGVSSAYGASYAVGDVIGMVYDNGTITMYKNGTSQGVLISGLTDPVAPMYGANSTISDVTIQQTLTYPVSGAINWATPLANRIAQNVGGAVGYEPVLQVASAAVPPTTFGQTVIATLLRARGDFLIGNIGPGRGYIYGTIKVDGSPDVPVSRRVRLYREFDGMLVREVWSDPVTGAYSFTDLDELHKYTVLSNDYTLNFRAVVADQITPEI